jgi:hypothetical protein
MSEDRLLEAMCELPYLATPANQSTSCPQDIASSHLDAFPANVDLLLADDDLLNL